MTLAVILLIGIFLRFNQISAPSLWMDEIWSIESATGRGFLHNNLPVGVIFNDPPHLTDLIDAPSWWTLWSARTDIRHPPLYPILLRWWIDLFGTSATAIRSLSALISIAAILVFFDICRLLHSPKVSLFAAAMMALAIPQLTTAQDARNFVLVIFLTLCCADQLVRIQILGLTHRRLAAFALFLCAMMLTNYICAGAASAIGLYALARLRGPALRASLASIALAAAFTILVWGIPFIHQLRASPPASADFLFEPGPNHLANTFRRLIGLPGQLLVGEDRAAEFSPSLLVAIAALTYLGPLLLLPWRRDLHLWLLWLFCTLGLVLLLDLTRHSMMLVYLRYSVLASPALYACFAASQWPRRPLVRDALPLLILGVLAVTTSQRLSDGVRSKEDWRQFSRDLNQAAAPDELLVFYGSDPWISPGMWLMGFDYYSPSSHRPWLILHDPAAPELLQQLQSRNSLWLVGTYPQFDGPILLPGWRPDRLMKNPTVGAACHMVRIASSTRP